MSAVVAAISYSGSESTFMIGPSSCTTIGDVARLIKGHPRIRISEITFDVAKPTGDIGRFADARIAARELGWVPNVEFREGLYELIDNILEDEK